AADRHHPRPADRRDAGRPDCRNVRPDRSHAARRGPGDGGGMGTADHAQRRALRAGVDSHSLEMSARCQVPNYAIPNSQSIPKVQLPTNSQGPTPNQLPRSNSQPTFGLLGVLGVESWKLLGSCNLWRWKWTEKPQMNEYSFSGQHHPPPPSGDRQG